MFLGNKIKTVEGLSRTTSRKKYDVHIWDTVHNYHSSMLLQNKSINGKFSYFIKLSKCYMCAGKSGKSYFV